MKWHIFPRNKWTILVQDPPPPRSLFLPSMWRVEKLDSCRNQAVKTIVVQNTECCVPSDREERIRYCRWFCVCCVFLF